MALQGGNDNSIGDKNYRWADMSEQERSDWWAYVRKHWVGHDKLMSGWATIKYPPGRGHK